MKSNEDKLCGWGYSKQLPHRSNVDNPWGWEFSRTQTCSTFSSGCHPCSHRYSGFEAAVSMVTVPLRSRVYVLSHFSHVWLFATLWTVACQAPLSMGFSRPESWSGLLILLQGIFLTQGLNPCLLCLRHCRQIIYLLNHQGSLTRLVQQSKGCLSKA